jgi:RNA polymerase sigma factor (TIGR02999 family)
MTPVTQLLEAANAGDRQAAAELLPLVYDELRKLAADRLVRESPGQTLNATGPVHEAYLRLVGDQKFDGRGHFFAAAAEAMRRIMIDRARKRATPKHGGTRTRVPFDEAIKHPDEHPQELLELDDALRELEHHSPEIASLVQLRFFGGLTHQEAAAQLGLSRRAADRL